MLGAMRSGGFLLYCAQSGDQIIEDVEIGEIDNQLAAILDAKSRGSPGGGSLRGTC